MKCMGKVPVDRERYIMVVIIGRIVAELVLGGRWDRVKVTLFIRRRMQEFSDFVDRCRRK